MFRHSLIALLATSTLALSAQTPSPAAPQVSPRAAYEEAMRPLDTTRDAISNWSEAELAALTVTMKQARTACAERDPKTYTGSDLMDLARLCALGQEWSSVIDATTRYIAADTPQKPLLIQAYAARLDAELYQTNEPAALADGLTLMKTLPFDGLSARAVDEAIAYMQFNFTADALQLAALREPFLLDLLRKSAATAPPATDSASSYRQLPTPAAHELYDQAIAYAALLQFAGQTDAASKVFADLESTLPKDLTADQLVPMATARQRYDLLGKPLPAIKALALLSLPNTIPPLPSPHAITALLLYPDWCAQCIRMTKQLPPTVFSVQKNEAYAYALLVETSPALLPPAHKDPNAPPAQPTARELLAETPTIVVPPATLDQLHVTDVPSLVLVDSHGIVRLIQGVGEDATRPGNTLDSAIARLGAFWPLNPQQRADKTPAAYPSASP